MATSKGRIYDYRLPLTMILNVNEWSETVKFWRAKIKELEDQGKNVSRLKSKLNLSIIKQIGK